MLSPRSGCTGRSARLVASPCYSRDNVAHALFHCGVHCISSHSSDPHRSAQHRSRDCWLYHPLSPLNHVTPRIVLGKNLREGRIEAGLTQVPVAERPGLIQRIFRRSKPATRTSGDAPDMVAIITLAPLKEAPQSGVVVRLPACLSPSPRASVHPEPQAKVEVLRLTVSTGMLDAAKGGRVPFR